MSSRSPFRYHHTIAPNLPRSTLFNRLAHEWVELNNSPSASSRVQAWGRQEPALAGFDRPCDIVDTIDLDTATNKDVRLLALLRLLQGGHDLAGRILLQQMLPKLSKMSVQMRARDFDTRWEEDRKELVVAEFWDIISAYPVQRRINQVASNLALDTLHRCVTRHPALQREIPVPDTYLLDAHAPTTEPREPSRLTQLVAWATRNAVLDRDDAELLVSIYVEEERPQDAAQRLGITYVAIRKRCSRAAQRLTQAVAGADPDLLLALAS